MVARGRVSCWFRLKPVKNQLLSPIFEIYIIFIPWSRNFFYGDNIMTTSFRSPCFYLTVHYWFPFSGTYVRRQVIFLQGTRSFRCGGIITPAWTWRGKGAHEMKGEGWKKGEQSVLNWKIPGQRNENKRLHRHDNPDGYSPFSVRSNDCRTD